MRSAQREAWLEQQLVHRLFTLRWTPGCMYTRVHGAADDDMTRWQIDTWARVLDETIPQLGDEYVSIIDTRSIGAIPRGLWTALVELAAGMVRQPSRRALIVADGCAGDDQGLAVQLVTAGNVRVFREEQRAAMITWLIEAGTISRDHLDAFSS